MIERVVELSPEKAFEELRSLLLKNKCKITAEEQTKSITVEQGSLWGVSPKGTKKTISFHLIPKDSETRIVSISSLTSDWIILSAVAYVLLGMMSVLFWWFATSLESSTLFEFSVAVSYFKILSILGAIGVIVQLLFDVYIYAKIDSFAEETLRLLP